QLRKTLAYEMVFPFLQYSCILFRHTEGGKYLPPTIIGIDISEPRAMEKGEEPDEESCNRVAVAMKNFGASLLSKTKD
ncbi:MAG: hypothetical protein ACI3YH_03480, partial [Eubacteriales bacterium]